MDESNYRNGRFEGRGVKTVSHFFLSEAPPPASAFSGSGKFETSKHAPSDKPPTAAAPAVHFLLCPEGLVSYGSFLGSMLALTLASNQISVGFVETTMRLPHTFFLSGGIENINALFWETDTGSPEFVNLIEQIRKTNDTVLVNADALSFFRPTDPLSISGRWIVPTTSRPDDVLNAYRVIKTASKVRKNGGIYLVVFVESNAKNATGAAIVLEQMTRRFLECSIGFLGVIPVDGDIVESGAYLSSPSLEALPEEAVRTIRETALSIFRTNGLQPF